MVSIRVTARGFKTNREILTDLITGHDETLERLLHKLGEDVVAEARHNIQQNQSIDSGRLISDIRILEEEAGRSITVGTTIPHAIYIEFGRGPIKPKDPDKWLHWIDKDTGKDVFSKFAKATEPMPFLAPAVESQSKIFKDIYAEENEAIIKVNANTLLDTELLD